MLTDTKLEALLADGHTLPARWYTDPAVLDLELERVFRRSWQYAGPAGRAAEPGDFFTCTAGRTPVVVVRDTDGALNAFVNVCRHRGHLVAQGSGRRATLQCPYHAWTYGLDGTLRTAPRSDRETCFDPGELSLHPVSVDTWGPFAFVSLDPQAPLAAGLGELPEIMAGSGLDLGAVRFRERNEWDFSGNWKVAVENYLECYHCPVAHPSFSSLIDVDPDAYRLEAHGTFTSQIGPVREAALSGNGGAPYDARGEVRHSQFHHLWPNTTINVNPGPQNVSIDVWLPADVERTAGFTDYFFGEDVPEALVADLMAFDRQVGSEDNALVASVQEGLRSHAVEHGRLLLESEKLIAHFQRLVHGALVD